MTEFMTVPGVHLDARAFPDGTGEGTAFQQATALARKHGALHVTDVDAVRRNKPDVDFLRDLCRNRPIWLDTGPRDMPDAMDALVAGCEHLTVRWTAVRRASDLDELVEIADPGTLRVMIEFDENGFIRNPRDAHVDADAVAKRALAHGAPVIVSAPAFDAALMRRFSPPEDEADAPRPWWYGPVTREETTELRRARYAGVIVPVPLVDEAAEGAKDAEVTPE